MIAVHCRDNSFSDRWINYLEQQNIPHKKVDCFHPAFWNEIVDCQALLWHWTQIDSTSAKFARQITFALEEMGILVFPSIKNAWHFDDKIGQAYLLAAIGAPAVINYVFFTKKQAMEWINNTTFPKIFKLRTGAGGINVKLVKTQAEARKLCRRAFFIGFMSFSNHLQDRKTKLKKLTKETSWSAILKKLYNFCQKYIQSNLNLPIERGYLYFQDYLPNNDHDTRITIIGQRAFGFIRYNRENDFRASGSGNICYDTEKIDFDCIRIAFDVAQKIKTRSLAFDFIYDQHKNPQIIEISYGYMSHAIYNCPGYFTPDLEFVTGNFHPEDLILKDILTILSGS